MDEKDCKVKCQRSGCRAGLSGSDLFPCHMRLRIHPASTFSSAPGRFVTAHTCTSIPTLILLHFAPVLPDRQCQLLRLHLI